MAQIVNARPEDVRRLAAALAAYKQEVAAAGKRVQGGLNAAHWHDPQKDAFQQQLTDFQRGINGFMNDQVDDMIKSLMRLAQRLDEI